MIDLNRSLQIIEVVWVSTNSTVLVIFSVLVVMHINRYISARKLDLWRYTMRARANIRRDALRGMEAFFYLAAGLVALFNPSPLPILQRNIVFGLLAVGPVFMGSNALLDAWVAYRLRYREGDENGDSMGSPMGRMAAGIDRLEAEAGRVRARKEDSEGRADAISGGEPGAAADAASQSGDQSVP